MNENIITNQNLKTSRKSNFELLRIICMILIVAHHFAVHSILNDSSLSISWVLMKILATGGKIAVNVYILISGYFLINSSFKLKKLIKLILQVFFYSITIYLLSCIFEYSTFSAEGFFTNFFPVFTSRYWFMSAYIVMYICSPFINKMIKSCSKKECLFLIGILLILQIAIPYSGISQHFSNVGWFITLYIIASYIRLYSHKWLDKNLIMLPVFLISYLIIILSTTIFNVSLWGLKNIVCIITSISLFCTFKNINFNNSKIINIISSATLGVYLIHDNNIIRPILWNKWLNIPMHSTLKTFPLFVLCSILIVFIACTMIELIRGWIESFICNKIIKKKDLR